MLIGECRGRKLRYHYRDWAVFVEGPPTGPVSFQVAVGGRTAPERLEGLIRALLRLGWPVDGQAAVKNRPVLDIPGPGHKQTRVRDLCVSHHPFRRQ
jgi:hypothetical protein